MTRSGKWIITGLITAVLLCVLVILSTQLYLAGREGGRNLLDMINRVIPGRISAESIRLDFFGQHALLRDVTVYAPDGRHVVQAKGVTIDLQLKDLMRRELIFSKVILESPRIIIERDSDNGLTIISAFHKKKKSVSPGLRVDIETFKATNATVLYKDKTGKVPLRLVNLQLDLSAEFGKQTMLRIKATDGRGALNMGGRAVDLGWCGMEGRILDESIEDVMIVSQKGSSHMKLSGSIAGLKQTPMLDCRLSLDVQLGDYQKDLKIPPDASGNLSGTINVSGKLTDPEISTRLVYGGMWNRIGLRKATLKGTYRDNIFTCRDLGLNLASGEMHLSGKLDLHAVLPHISGSRTDVMNGMAYDVKAACTNLQLSDLKLRPGLQGVLNAQAALAGKGLSLDNLGLQASLSGTLAAFRADNRMQPLDLKVEGTVRLSQSVVNIDDFQAESSGARLDAHGWVDVKNHTLNGNMDFACGDVAPLLGVYAIPVKGLLNVHAGVQGGMRHPEADIRISGRGLSYKKVWVKTLNMVAQLDSAGQLTIQSAKAASNTSMVQANGTLQLFDTFPHFSSKPGFALDLKAADLAVQDFFPHIKLAGGLNTQAVLSCKNGELDGEIMLRGTGFSYRGAPSCDLEFSAGLAGTDLLVKRAALSRGSSQLAAQGSVSLLQDKSRRLSRDPRIDISITQGLVELNDLNEDSSGQIMIGGAVHGSLLHPVGIAGVHAADIIVAGQPIDSVTASLRLDGESVNLDPLQIELSKDQVVSASGYLNFHGDYSLKAGSQGFDLQNIVMLGDVSSLKGRAVLSMHGQGNLSEPHAQAMLKVKDVMYQGTSLLDANLELELSGDDMNFTGNLNFPFEGRLNLADRRLKIKAVFDQTSLTPYFGLLNRPLLTGQLSGRLDVDSSADDLASGAYQFDLHDLIINFDGLSLIAADSAQGSYEQGELKLPLTHIKLIGDGNMEISGRGNKNAGYLVDAQGILPMEVIGAILTPLDDATGNIRFNSQLRLLHGVPTYTFRAVLEEISCPLPVGSQKVESLNGTIQLSEDRFTIDALSGYMESGSFSLKGGMVLGKQDRPGVVDFQAQAKYLPVEIPQAADLLLDADLSLSGTDRNALLKGDITILEGTYYKDVNINIVSNVLERILLHPKAKPRSVNFEDWPLVKQVGLDVRVKRRGELSVDNNIAQLDLNPDLKITGRLLNPLILGRVSVTEGTLYFQGNDFTVSHGVIDFSGTTGTVATVDITSETTVGDYTITLSLEGPPDNLQVTFSSSPELEQPDIISLLLVGKTTEALSESSNGMSASPAAMVGELLVSTYGKQIKTATSLDIFKLESSDFSTSEEQSENMKLTLGKDLSRRLSVKYQVETKDSQTIQWGVAEYKLFDNLLINSYQGTNGVYGADLQLKYELR